MIEIFKNIPGYNGYQISNLRNVKSLPKFRNTGNGGYISKEKILKQSIDVYGYLYVALYKNKKRVTQPIHKLMAITFLGHKPNKWETVIDHIDNNPLNNNLENLQLITHRENITKGLNNKNTSSKYIGVSFNKSHKKWQSFIRIPKGKNISLGIFDTEVRASIAYNFALSQINELKLLIL